MEAQTGPPRSTSQLQTLIQLSGIARVLLSSATSANVRTATSGNGIAVSGSCAHFAATVVASIRSFMGMERKDRGFTVEKRQDTGAGLRKVVKTGG